MLVSLTIQSVNYNNRADTTMGLESTRIMNLITKVNSTTTGGTLNGTSEFDYFTADGKVIHYTADEAVAVIIGYTQDTIANSTGTTSNTFKIDSDNATSHVTLKNLAGVLQVLDKDGTGLANVSSLSLTATDAAATTATVNAITASAVTTGNVLSLTGAAQTTGNILLATGGGATMASGAAVISAVMGAATAGSGVEIVSTGVYTGTDGLLNITANSATTGDMGIVISATGQTTGNLIVATGGGATLATGGSIARFNMGAATAGSGLELVTSGVYTGTDGVLNVSATAATTGQIAVIDGSGITTGDVVRLKATEATLTSGNYIHCYDGAATDFKVARYGATTIAGNASGTAALTVTAGDILLSSGTGNINGAFTANTINFGTGGGVADVQTVACVPTIKTLTTGQLIIWKPVADNTGACTLNVDGLGAKSVKTQTGADPAAVDLDATGIAMAVYDGTNYVLINPATTCD